MFIHVGAMPPQNMGAIQRAAHESPPVRGRIMSTIHVYMKFCGVYTEEPGELCYVADYSICDDYYYNTARKAGGLAFNLFSQYSSALAPPTLIGARMLTGAPTL